MWRYIWLLAAYFLVTLLPLVSRIGRNLEYEYALAVSLLALLVFPLLAVGFPKKYIPVFGPQFRPPISFEIIWIFFFSPFVMLTPGFLLLATEVCSCSTTGFYFWMLIQTLPAWYMGHVFYYLILKLRHDGMSRSQAFAAQVCIWVVILAVIVIVMWFFPQKRLVSLFVGFLHGPIYDDWIPVDHGIFLARVSHLFMALALMALIWFRKKKNHLIVVSILSTVAVLLFFFSFTFESVGNGRAVLNRNFNGKFDHGNLHFYYVQKEGAKTASSSVTRLFKDAVFHYEDLGELLGVDHPRVDVYLYPDTETKKLWFGGGATDVTDVVTPSIHITHSGWPHPTLRHEMVHALSSYFAFYGLGFHPNMALTEGLAVALAPESKGLTLDHSSALLLKQKRLPELTNLFSVMFWKESGRRAYTVSGSIINFIIREKGFRAVRDLYSGRSWKVSVGETQEETMMRWLEYITDIARTLPDNLSAERLYRYDGIMHDLCPHSKADLAQARSTNLYTRLRQPVGWDPQKDYLLWRVQLEPENKGLRFRLWMQQIENEASERMVRKGRLVTWIKTLEGSRQMPPKTIEDVESAIVQSDLERTLYGGLEGRKILENLRKVVRADTVGEDMMRQIEARLLLDDAVSGPDTILWRKYLAGWSAIPKARSDDEPWIVQYLRLRNGSGFDRERLKKVHNMPIPANVSSVFHLEWYKFLGHRYYQNHLYDQAVSAYGEAMKYAQDDAKRSIELWEKKARFFSEKKKSI